MIQCEGDRDTMVLGAYHSLVYISLLVPLTIHSLVESVPVRECLRGYLLVRGGDTGRWTMDSTLVNTDIYVLVYGSTIRGGNP